MSATRVVFNPLNAAAFSCILAHYLYVASAADAAGLWPRVGFVAALCAALLSAARVVRGGSAGSEAALAEHALPNGLKVFHHQVPAPREGGSDCSCSTRRPPSRPSAPDTRARIGWRDRFLVRRNLSR
jgi:hypothetical protein